MPPRIVVHDSRPRYIVVTYQRLPAEAGSCKGDRPCRTSQRSLHDLGGANRRMALQN